MKRLIFFLLLRRRFHEDLHKTLQIILDFVTDESAEFFSTVGQGNFQFELSKPRMNAVIHQNVFVIICVNQCDRLPSEIDLVLFLNCFKPRLGKISILASTIIFSILSFFCKGFALHLSCSSL